MSKVNGHLSAMMVGLELAQSLPRAQTEALKSVLERGRLVLLFEGSEVYKRQP